MSRKYCVIKENQKMRTLLSIIKSNYCSDNKDSLQEVNLEHVLNRIFNDDIKNLVRNTWKDFEILVGQEIRLLENNCKKSFINKRYKKTKDMSFIIKSKSSSNDSDVSHNFSNNMITVEHRYIEI